MQQHFTAHDAPGLLNQPHEGKGGDALATARFADQTEHLALLQVEGDAVHSVNRLPLNGEVCAQVADVQ